ncbi:MAG: class I SAM-dependent methyltransferase [Planctomycetes bacterium]|nr:class I SAM-dependent methyltransferase [Planctomycetota bacterium]
MSSLLWPYRSPGEHEAVAAIIRRRSSNRQDVREAALNGLDLAAVRSVLDLGCGYGFMAEVLAQRVAPDAKIVGVDAWESNEPAFLERVGAAGREASFVRMRIGHELPFEDHSFDLVSCCYSLYFFAGILPEVARVLTREGLLLAITHTEDSVAGQLPEAGFGKAATRLRSLTRKFSAENGRGQLEKCFGEVTRIDYRNRLRFGPDHADDLLVYLRFKLPFLVPNCEHGDDLPVELARYATEALARDGGLVISKDDAVFRCRSPLCR